MICAIFAATTSNARRILTSLLFSISRFYFYSKQSVQTHSVFNTFAFNTLGEEHSTRNCSTCQFINCSVVNVNADLLTLKVSNLEILNLGDWLRTWKFRRATFFVSIIFNNTLNKVFLP